MPLLPTNDLNLSASLSSEMLMTSRPSSLNFSYARLTLGSSLTHGPHQVAQKSTSTTLPLKSASANFLLDIGSVASNTGNALPTNSAATAAAFNIRMTSVVTTT